MRFLYLWGLLVTFSPLYSVRQCPHELSKYRDVSTGGYICTLNNCGRTFDTSSGLVKHGVSKHFYCYSCNQQFNSLEVIKKHRSQLHSYGRPQEVSTSSQTSSSSLEPLPLLGARINIPQPRLADDIDCLHERCEYCLALFSTYEHQILHAALKHNYCGICWKGFTSQSECSTHFKNHKLEIINKVCPLCTDFAKEFPVFNNYKEVVVHALYMHNYCLMCHTLLPGSTVEIKNAHLISHIVQNYRRAVGQEGSK